MKNVILTGATGFLGKNFLKLLLSSNVTVYALIRNDIDFKDRNLIVINDSLKNIHKYKSYFKHKSIETFYHLAWEGSRGLLRNDLQIQQNNLELALICYSFSNEINAKKFISTGTISENLVNQFSLNSHRSITYYALYKYFTWLLLLKYSNIFKTKLIWAKMSNLYGLENNFDNLIPYTITNLLNNKIVEFSNAKNYYDFLHVSDASIALMLLGEKTELKSSYYIGSGEPMILKEYLETVGRLFEKEDLMKFGVRLEDGLDYDIRWFSIEDLQLDTGFRVMKDFKNHILELREEYYELHKL